MSLSLDWNSVYNFPGYSFTVLIQSSDAIHITINFKINLHIYVFVFVFFYFPDCFLMIVHYLLKKPFNLESLTGLPGSLKYTGIWYCWILEWSPQYHSKIFLTLHPLSLIDLNTLVIWFCQWMLLYPERVHLFSFLVMIRHQLKW